MIIKLGHVHYPCISSQPNIETPQLGDTHKFHLIEDNHN